MLVSGALILAATYLCGHWLAGAAVAVLLFGWKLLATGEGPPVLAMAFTYQWAQVSIGLFYARLTGDTLPAFEESDWETMMLIGLGCVTALAVGIHYGIAIGRRNWQVSPDSPHLAFSWKTLAIAYAASVVLVGATQQLAWQIPMLTQAILAVTYARLGLLFLIVRRLSQPTYEWKWIGGLVGMEIVLGFTGFFAGFREPLILAVIATLEVFDRRKFEHWALVGVLVGVLGFSSLLWMGVHTEYRQDFESDVFAASRSVRLERMRTLSSGWLQQDTNEMQRNLNALVDRLWAIYYPALALDRVPNVLPHTDGEILYGALLHLVTPRVLFPNKADLPSDSEMVRKYSGVFVAGAEAQTSIAFGYAAESYVDFGLPLMFLPVLVYGLVIGFAYQWFMVNIRHRELAIALATVVFWLSLYLFERSWIKTLGLALTLMVYLGGLTFLFDRWFLIRSANEQELAARMDDPLVGTTQR